MEIFNKENEKPTVNNQIDTIKEDEEE